MKDEEKVEWAVTELNTQVQFPPADSEMEQAFLLTFYGHVFGMPLVDEPEELLVGKCSFVLVSLENDFIDALDAYSSEHLEYGERVLALDASDALFGNLLIVDWIEIDPAYRGHGMGVEAMKSILVNAEQLHATRAIARAWDLDRKKPSPGLSMYWQQAGLKHVGDGFLYADLTLLLPWQLEEEAA